MNSEFISDPYVWNRFGEDATRLRPRDGDKAYTDGSCPFLMYRSPLARPRFLADVRHLLGEVLCRYLLGQLRFHICASEALVSA